VPTKCWHANRSRLSSNNDIERTNRAIAKIAGRIEEEAIAHRIEVSSMPRFSYRAILPRTSSKRSSSSFRGILAFIPRAFLVELPRRLSLSRRCAKENWTRKNIGEEDEGGRFPSRFLQMSQAGPRSLSCFCGWSRKTLLFLRYINSRWRVAKCERRSRDNGHDDARPVLHSSSSGTLLSLYQPVTSVHHSSSLFSLHSCVWNSSYEITLTHGTLDFLFGFSLTFCFLSKLIIRILYEP